MRVTLGALSDKSQDPLEVRVEESRPPHEFAPRKGREREREAVVEKVRAARLAAQFLARPPSSFYDVVVTKQPTQSGDLAENCTVANGSGTVASNVDNVQIDCVPVTGPFYTVTINNGQCLPQPPAGLSVTLSDSIDTFSVSVAAGAGPYVFPTSLPEGTYTVSATSSIGCYACMLWNASGPYADACPAPESYPSLSVTLGPSATLTLDCVTSDPSCGQVP
jgi:hypothetical protein